MDGCQLYIEEDKIECEVPVCTRSYKKPGEDGTRTVIHSCANFTSAPEAPPETTAYTRAPTTLKPKTQTAHKPQTTSATLPTTTTAKKATIMTTAVLPKTIRTLQTRRKRKISQVVCPKVKKCPKQRITCPRPQCGACAFTNNRRLKMGFLPNWKKAYSMVLITKPIIIP